MTGIAPQLTVVLPVFNEAENLPPLIAELTATLRPLGTPFEIIAVDDASTDASVAVLQALQTPYPELRLLRHRFNAGQSAAFAAGFAHARGAVIVMLDADGQNDPHDIPSLLAALRPDVACVTGVRQQRQDSRVRKLSSRFANTYRNWITGDHITDAGCTFRVVRREALREVPVFNGLHRFLPTILRRQGFTVLERPVHHRSRTRGVSKYGVRNRLWRGLRDCFAMRWYAARAIRADRLHPESEPPPAARP
ncbi:MAG: glycosyltransferase family 2 protein [Verrucomicrobia bacterium]|nr:glycosyltransferase family 2 protein [Verrucomicrobiota bacterium]